MDKKLKKGDKVRMRRTVCFDYITFEKGCVGEVSADEDNKGFCRIRMKNAESGEMTEHFICACNLEPIDSKTAFLSELKGLLEKYGYSISSGINFGESDTYKAFGGMGFISSDESRDIDYNPKYGCITPNNIMDYEKE